MAIKQEVQKIRDNEQKDSRGKVKEKSVKLKDEELPEIQDEFNVEVGTPFDYIFKERAELIDSQKAANNKMMDDLVASLGYMDYRDALACNKYIIEAKRSGDYHQIARGRILETAFNRLNKEKQTEVREKSNQSAQKIHDAQLKSA